MKTYDKGGFPPLCHTLFTFSLFWGVFLFNQASRKAFLKKDHVSCTLKDKEEELIAHRCWWCIPGRWLWEVPGAKQRAAQRGHQNQGSMKKQSNKTV